MRRSDIVASARACIGARFRPQGRDPATGLDCIGLVGAAFGCANLPADYPQRGASRARIEAEIRRAGLVPMASPRPGDLLLCATGPVQWHLVVLTGNGFVHADAGLRRVVETPGAPPWPIAGAWGCAVETTVTELGAG